MPLFVFGKRAISFRTCQGILTFGDRLADFVKKSYPKARNRGFTAILVMGLFRVTFVFQ